MKLFLRALLDTLFPPLCHHCKAPLPTPGDIHLCAGCYDGIGFIASPLCRLCGFPFATAGGSDHLCGSCLSTPPSFAAARAAMLFDGPARRLIHSFKYEQKVHFGTSLGLLTTRHLESFARQTAADLLIPVPLHLRRLRERGYNQAVLLGEHLARQWQMPLMRNNLRRHRWTDPQISLNAAERVSNVRGAFAVSRQAEIRGRRIILVDDVYTTGSTVNECARTLHGSGAAAVFVVTAVRAVA